MPEEVDQSRQLYGSMGLRFFLIFLLFNTGGFSLANPLAGQAILNVERLHGDEREGFSGGVSARVRMASGNTDLVQLGGDLGLGHLSEHHWIRFYAGAEQLRHEGKDDLDNRYLHLRYNYLFTRRWRSFHFLQIQSNRNLLLDRRVLFGSGIRRRLFGGTGHRLDLGSGLMLEMERLNNTRLDPGDDARTETVRLANVLVGSGPLGQGNRWVGTVYFQPNVGSMGDYRLSAEAGLGLVIVSSLGLDLTLTWRHDNRVPGDLDEDDVEMKTGFTYSFQ